MLIFFFFLLAVARGAAPIPQRAGDVGWELLTASAPAQIEIFGDFSCDDTAAAWQTIVKPLVERFYNTNALSLIYHVYPLPYHHNSFDAGQSGRVMVDYLRLEEKNNLTSAVVKACDALFLHQTDFMSWQTPDPTENLTQAQVIHTIFADIARSAGVPRNFFLQSMGSGWNMTYFEPTRDAWKYAAARGICATPTFAANGVFDDDLSSWSLDNWTSWVLDANAAA
ncbi:hypothetical protein CTAYLR_005628 [Chrysophaeum taylorii]|uniref:Uncharacterized protein n=1 Tax=Chrysophaeum taylorii TaxID=2483200 RepID=A0AAD7UPC8_9STRA|nr:hypothetical protein CTAYLR_005628 [Chrysophaeum taylorii]